MCSPLHHRVVENRTVQCSVLDCIDHDVVLIMHAGWKPSHDPQNHVPICGCARRRPGSCSRADHAWCLEQALPCRRRVQHGCKFGIYTGLHRPRRQASDRRRACAWLLPERGLSACVGSVGGSLMRMDTARASNATASTWTPPRCCATSGSQRTETLKFPCKTPSSRCEGARTSGLG